jgi:aminoglycoside 6'-N-acetyltransferase I
VPVRPIDPSSTADRAAWGRMRLILFDDLDPAFNAADMAAFEARHEQQVFLAFVGDDSDSAAAHGGGEADPAEKAAGDMAVGFAEAALRNLVDGCLSSPVGYLEAIYVDPAARGLGLGRALLDAAIEWAREQGCTEFATDSELSDAPAQDFHRAMGMKEAYRIVQFRREI